MVGKRDIDAWRICAYPSFDGPKENCFSKTSLRLSFTKSYGEIPDGSRGTRFHQAYFLESVVQIYDQDKWIADLDVLGALDSRIIRRIEEKYALCDSHQQGKTSSDLVKSLEDWDHILDLPNELSVAQANGNWIARLALTTVLEQIGNKATEVLETSDEGDGTRENGGDDENEDEDEEEVEEEKEDEGEENNSGDGKNDDDDYVHVPTQQSQEIKSIIICPKKMCWDCYFEDQPELLAANPNIIFIH